eukprot:Rmarinus@m.12898
MSFHNVRRKQLNLEERLLQNRLLSIVSDAKFIEEIRRRINFPIFANIRCGLWYHPQFEGTSYFKSTDGHYGHWAFSVRRLNIHVAQAAIRNGGVVLVDSSRRGKRMPDSFTKTVPIWCAVLNQALKILQPSLPWDPYSLKVHVAPWILKEEASTIDMLTSTWTKSLLSTIPNLTHVLSDAVKPFYPVFVSSQSDVTTESLQKLGETYNLVICVQASRVVESGRLRERGWTYIQGAGDDQENWALGLTPAVFWRHVAYVLGVEDRISEETSKSEYCGHHLITTPHTLDRLISEDDVEERVLDVLQTQRESSVPPAIAAYSHRSSLESDTESPQDAFSSPNNDAPILPNLVSSAPPAFAMTSLRTTVSFLPLSESFYPPGISLCSFSDIIRTTGTPPVDAVVLCGASPAILEDIHKRFPPHSCDIDSFLRNFSGDKIEECGGGETDASEGKRQGVGNMDVKFDADVSTHVRTWFCCKHVCALPISSEAKRSKVWYTWQYGLRSTAFFGVWYILRSLFVQNDAGGSRHISGHVGTHTQTHPQTHCHVSCHVPHNCEWDSSSIHSNVHTPTHAYTHAHTLSRTHTHTHCRTHPPVENHNVAHVASQGGTNLDSPSRKDTISAGISPAQGSAVRTPEVINGTFPRAFGAYPRVAVACPTGNAAAPCVAAAVLAVFQASPLFAAELWDGGRDGGGGGCDDGA